MSSWKLVEAEAIAAETGEISLLAFRVREV
jgi:hypothetical protein